MKLNATTEMLALSMYVVLAVAGPSAAKCMQSVQHALFYVCAFAVAGPSECG